MAKQKKKTVKKSEHSNPLKNWWAQKDDEQRNALRQRSLLFIIFCVVVAGVVVGMRQLEGYVQQITAQRQVELQVQLLNPPDWAGDSLIRDICLSTGIRSDDFLLDKELPAQWAQALGENPWVNKVNLLHRSYDGIVRLDCDLRRPIAKVRQGSQDYYLDAEGVVLPAGEIIGRDAHLVMLRGEVSRLPQAGTMIDSMPLMAGLQVLAMIRKVDEALPEPQRLWAELSAMDVSNYEGRQDPRRAHLMLYTTNQTEVRWGAAVGKSRGYAEASAEQKLRLLYLMHRQEGTLNRYRHLDLRDEQKRWTDPLREEGGA